METSKEVKLVWKGECQARNERVTGSIIEDGDTEAAEECTVPQLGGTASYDFPKCEADSFTSLIKEYSDLFNTTPGSTTLHTNFWFTHQSAFSTHLSPLCGRGGVTD